MHFSNEIGDDTYKVNKTCTAVDHNHGLFIFFSQIIYNIQRLFN